MNKEIKFLSAVVDITEDGYINIYLDSDRGWPRDNIILNDGIVELNDKEEPIAIYGYQAIYREFPIENVDWRIFYKELKEDVCKRFVVSRIYKRFKWKKSFPFYEIFEEERLFPTNSLCRLKKMNDFRLEFVNNCRVSVYRGNALRRK